MAATWQRAWQHNWGGSTTSIQQLLVWSFTGNTNRRKEFRSQLVRVLGKAVDNMIVGVSSGEEWRGMTYEVTERSEDDDIDRCIAHYWTGCGEFISETPSHLSAAPDKSRVGGVGMMTSPVCIPGNYCAYACPQDFGGGLWCSRVRPAVAWPRIRSADGPEIGVC